MVNPIDSAITAGMVCIIKRKARYFERKNQNIIFLKAIESEGRAISLMNRCHPILRKLKNSASDF